MKRIHGIYCSMRRERDEAFLRGLEGKGPRYIGCCKGAGFASGGT